MILYTIVSLVSSLSFLAVHQTVVYLGSEVTAGKFYASFLIQDYFKKYRKRKEKEKKKKGKDKSASLQVHI